jgi:NAD(P)-dependent dehydrogenase (short-subunit alcohol dehydrogenase family)
VLLENKNAVIFGGGGAIGGAVARRFAQEGAQVSWRGTDCRRSRSLHAKSRQAADRLTRPRSML